LNEAYATVYTEDMAKTEPQQKRTWKWNKPKEEAAQLLASDELTDAEISKKVGIRRQTLWEWKKRPEFMERVQACVGKYGDLAGRYAIGRKARRLAALEDRWERMRKLIEARAEAAEMMDAPGGDTGLLCHTQKSIGAGPSAEKVDEYEVDTGLLKELREHEKQAAVELGQWTEKREHSNPDLDTLIAAELARLTGRGQGSAAGEAPGDPDAGTS
jgi:hypothetical protein